MFLLFLTFKSLHLHSLHTKASLWDGDPGTPCPHAPNHLIVSIPLFDNWHQSETQCCVITARTRLQGDDQGSGCDN